MSGDGKLGDWECWDSAKDIRGKALLIDNWELHHLTRLVIGSFVDD
jgi:hypothetical protein